MSATRSRSNPASAHSFLVRGVLFSVLYAAVNNWPFVVQQLELRARAGYPEYLQFILAAAARNAENLLLGVRFWIWLVGASLVNRILSRFFWDGLLVQKLGRPVPSVLKDMGTLFVYMLASVGIAAAIFDKSITGFIATLGAGSVVVGLALKNLLSDLFTGLAVNFDNNFAIGDWLIVPSSTGQGGTVGRVDEISWRCTRLHCEDGTTVVVPNSILGEEKVINISRPSEWTRYQAEITLDYSIPVERARLILLAALQSLSIREGFSKEHAPRVLVGTTSERGVEYLLRYWIYPWQPVSPSTSRDLVLSAALQHLLTAGITPAYAKQEVYYEQLPPKFFKGHSVVDKVALLSRITLFERLTEEDLHQLAEEMERRQLSAGETLFRRNDAGSSLFILIEGLLNVQVDLKGEGTEETVSQLSPGDFFGEMSLLTGEPRSATIQTRTPAVVCEICHSAILHLIEKRPEVLEGMSRAVAERQINLSQARSRIADSEAAEKVQSIASHLMGKMKSFFQSS
jgi:small-conductance mechanosensitive channel/CRP-like cAMP-binding protein